MGKPKYFKTQNEFRKWLASHHFRTAQLEIGFYKVATGTASITYRQALDEALCFGWIDGVRRRIDAQSYSIRFTPRREKSNWSLVNCKRFAELSEMGLVQPSGKGAFERRPRQHNEYSFERKERKLTSALEKLFRKNKSAWEFFNSQPPGYRKTASWWVISAKQEATRLRRLELLIADSAKKRRLGVVTAKKVV